MIPNIKRILTDLQWNSWNSFSSFVSAHNIFLALSLLLCLNEIANVLILMKFLGRLSYTNYNKYSDFKRFNPIRGSFNDEGIRLRLHQAKSSKLMHLIPVSVASILL